MRLRLKGLTLLLLLVLLVLCSSAGVCDARSGRHWRQKKVPSTSMLRRKGKGKNGNSHRQYRKGYQNPYQPSPSRSPNVPVSPSESPVQSKGHQSPTMPTPSVGNGYTPPSPPPPQLPPPPPTAPSQETVFNVVDFGGQGDGVTDDTQVASTASQNVCFQLKSIVTLDAFQQYNVELEKMPQIKPTALRFYGSSNVTVTGISIVNSSQCHLKFDSCQGVMVHDITISSPENSPNTDGIHR